MSWYEELLQRAERAYARGDTETALALFEAAEQRALAEGDQVRADRAYCNRSTVLIDLERGAECVPRLQEILLRTTDGITRWMASYSVAMAHYGWQDLERAESWCRRARQAAAALADPIRRAATENLLGNIALVRSEFHTAEQGYRLALEVYEKLDGYHRLMSAQIEDNLGYVLVCTDRVRDGIGHCERSRQTMEELGAEHYLHQPLQDLCYGYLLAGDAGRARDYGERGLELALELDDRLVVKNCLFLLSEVAIRQGDRFRARRFLTELANYYPDLAIGEELIDIFMDMDLTRVVNLRGS